MNLKKFNNRKVIFIFVAFMLVLSACNLPENGSGVPDPINTNTPTPTQPDPTRGPNLLTQGANLVETFVAPKAVVETETPALTAIVAAPTNTPTTTSTPLATVVPATLAPTEPVYTNPMDYFVPEISGCEAINAKWFDNEVGILNGEKLYLVDPNDTSIYLANRDNIFEGRTELDPNAHTNRVIIGEPFKVFGGNAWSCPKGTKEQLGTQVWSNWAKKVLNEETVPEWKKYVVIDPVLGKRFEFDMSPSYNSTNVEIWPPTVPRTADPSLCPKLPNLQQAFGGRKNNEDRIHVVALSNNNCNIFVFHMDGSGDLYKGTDPILAQYPLSFDDEVYVVNLETTSVVLLLKYDWIKFLDDHTIP